MMRHPNAWLKRAALAATVVVAAGTRADELWLHDDSRLYGLIERVTDDGKLLVQLPEGTSRQVPFDEIVAVRFLGRDPTLLQSGTEELRFVNGGQIRGQIVENVGDRFGVLTDSAGRIEVDLARLRGLVSLPLEGFSGRKAEELVESPADPIRGASLDVVLDKRGSVYPGVLRRLDRTEAHLYHEEMVRIVPIKASYVAGVRLADSGRDAPMPWAGDVQMRFYTRDGSVVRGKLVRTELGRWIVNPAWDEKSLIEIRLDEISLAQVMGGRVQYLSQLTPVEVNEKTTLAPPQPHRMDASCQGDAISIAGRRYPWGIGVHADSALTFEVGGAFKWFRADVGIATRSGRRGTVVFSVLGDGKELYASPVVTGADERPCEVSVSVAGVKRLTLKATDAGDLDLDDAANWGAARVLR
jgi:hypothetical protein